MKRILLVLVLVGLSCLSAYPQKKQSKNFTIRIEVSAKNEELKKNIYSYVSREIRSLSDVDIVDNDTAYYNLLLNSVEFTDKRGYAISWILENRVICNQQILYHNFLSNLFITPLDKLQSSIAETITFIDTEVLEPKRKLP